MDITYLGHSSFKIKTRSATIITDPFDEYVGFKLPKTEADIVTISHDHKDHNRADLVLGAKIVNGPGEYEISQVSIIGISSFHDTKKGQLRGANTIYIFEAEGLRLVHMGDIGETLSDKKMELLGDVDVLMIPVGGEYTINAKEAAEMVRGIEPKIIIPMHYLVDGMSKDFEKLTKVEVFLSEMGLPSEKQDKLTIKKEMLGEEQKVVVLNKK